MPIETEIHIDKGLVRSKATGLIRTDEYIQALKSTITRSDFRPTFSHLVDLTELYSPPVVHHTKEMTDILRIMRRAFEGKIAVVASDQAVLTIANLVSLLAAKEGIRLRAFGDYNEAKMWLGIF